MALQEGLVLEGGLRAQIRPTGQPRCSEGSEQLSPRRRVHPGAPGDVGGVRVHPPLGVDLLVEGARALPVVGSSVGRLPPCAALGDVAHNQPLRFFDRTGSSSAMSCRVTWPLWAPADRTLTLP